jgi:hypothetical protein
MSPRHLDARWPALSPFAVASLLALSSPPAASQEEPGPAGKSLRLELPTVTTRVGEQFEVRLQAHTGTPLSVFALRVEAAPAQVRLRSWSFGEGLLNHIAEHGEPPACDIVVYPDGSRMFAVMVMDPPFSSQDHGSECFVLRFQVEAESPGMTCILYSGDTPDYEPGDDLLTVISRMTPERRCAPVVIAGGLTIRRGDADGDTRRTITDAIHILDHLFLGAPEPDCADASDANDDGLVNVSDGVFLLGVLFLGTDPPWMDCGPDRTTDSLPECSGPSC